MGALSQNEQRKLAYFHALGKAMSENTQEVYESKYKSSHNVRLNEVWSDDIVYAPTFLTAYAESLINSAVTFFSGVTLTEIGGSNGQAYSYISGGTFIRPFISPVDIPHPQTNIPSVGYQFELYKGDGTHITLTEGSWAVDYYAGIIHFAQGYTPTDMGWGAIKGSFFQYSGNFGASGTTGGFTTAIFNSGSNQIIFNSGLSTETILDLTPLSDKSGFTNVNFNTLSNILTFNSGGTNEQFVDLSTLMNISGYTTAIFNSGSNQMIFNQGGINETIVDLSLLYNNSGFTTVQFNSGNSELIFNLGSINEQIIDLSGLVDVSAFTSVSVNQTTNIVTFNSGNTNEQTIDLSFLQGNSGLTTVTFNSGNNYLIFNSGLSSETFVDLTPLKTLSGTTSLLSYSNYDMVANTTTFSSNLACNTGISNDSIDNSNISVFINGVQVTVGNGVKTKDCYFSGDGGTTAKSFSNILIGDLLYWSYDGFNQPISGFELNSLTDKISFMYLTL